MTVLIDSWAWIEYFRGSEAGKKAREYIEGGEELLVSTVNLAEIYRWFLKYYDEASAEKARGIIKRRCVIIDVDEEIAVKAAKIRHEMGWGLGDSIIYATARRENAKVLTGDEDFKGVEGVIYIGK